jgi:xanthine dehydrogenase accessory factor
MKHRLIVIGKGLVGQQLAKLAAQLDFDVQHVSEDDLDALLPALETSTDDFVAIVARDWERDRQALAAFGDRPLKYLGMIGCHKKLADIPPEALAKLHAPIGLDIGSKTPLEIAVSICAELIAVRSGRGT